MIPEKPLNTVQAWKRADVGQSGEWLHELTDVEVKELLSALAHAKATGKALDQITSDDFPLKNVSRLIADWVEKLRSGLGFVQVKGFPAQDLSKEDNAVVYWGIGQHMGRLVPQNTHGDLLGHIRDTGDDPEDFNVRLYRTRARQDFHADGSDIISLMCLHPSMSGGESKLVSSVAIFNEIMRTRPELIPLLFEDFYFDLHGQEREGEPGFWTMPICTYSNGSLRTWFAEWYIRNAQRFEEVPRLTQEQDELVSLIVEIDNDPAFHVDIDFEVGDFQFLKNSTILHARGEYEDYPEPERKRHLYRLWIARDDFNDVVDGLREGITDPADI